MATALIALGTWDIVFIVIGVPWRSSCSQPRR